MSKRDELLFLQDILDSVNAIFEFTTNLRDLKDFRNLLIHEYFGVDSQIIWNTIQNDLPLLRESVKEMIKNN